MSKWRGLWLKSLYFVGKQRKAVDYARYHGLSLNPTNVLHIANLKRKRVIAGLSSATLLGLATYFGLKRIKHAHGK